MALGEHNKHALGVFRTRQEAEAAIQELQNAGFPRDQISVVARDADGNKDIAGVEVKDTDRTDRNDVAEGAKAGAVTGGIGGAILGALEALGITTFAALLLPGAGQVLVFGTVAANAIATAIAGGAIGAAAGGLVGALVGWGVPDEQARVYHDLVAQGEYLVMVEGSDEQIRMAESVLSSRGIREWGVYDRPGVVRDRADYARDTFASGCETLHRDDVVTIIDCRDKTV